MDSPSLTRFTAVIDYLHYSHHRSIPLARRGTAGRGTERDGHPLALHIGGAVVWLLGRRAAGRREAIMAGEPLGRAVTRRSMLLGVCFLVVPLLAACASQTPATQIVAPTVAAPSPAPSATAAATANTIPSPAATVSPATTASAAPTATGSSPPTVYHSVLPKETDPAIDDALGAHLAGAPACADPRRDFLVVYLPATGGAPSEGKLLLDLATGHCFHAIGLNYPVSQAVFADCANDPNPDCYEQWRLQKLDGVQRSAHLTTTPPNGIENRLLKLLRYLATTFPSEGWDRYLDGGAVRWPAVIATGHSQGGGMAAILGKVHPLARVAMLSAPVDTIGGYGGTSPAWVGKAGATPADRYYGFAHMKDQYWQGEQKNWAALTLTQFGPIVNVGGAAAPYQGSHTLTTDIASGNPHGSTISFANAEKFGAVWAYLLIPA